MAQQHKLTKRHNLFDEAGRLLEAGYGTEYILDYNKEAVADKEGLKEWEYYLALERQFGFAISIAANYAGTGRRISVHLLDFEKGESLCETDFVIGAPDGFSIPADVNKTIHFKSERTDCLLSGDGKTVHMALAMKNLAPGKDVKADITFTVPAGDKMLLVVPYDEPEKFYYNYKINCMPVAGYVEFAGDTRTFGPDVFGTYDWGRGVWQPVNQWYWGSASTRLDGKDFGFNIGHGFGDTSAATENMIFYDGKAHKLDEVEFRIPGDAIGDLRLVLPDEAYMKPWRFVSTDGRLDMDFVPLHDRSSDHVEGEYFAGQHQVFGLFSGTAVLDDGTQLPFRDVFGFAEKVGNVWP